MAVGIKDDNEDDDDCVVPLLVGFSLSRFVFFSMLLLRVVLLLLLFVKNPFFHPESFFFLLGATAPIGVQLSFDFTVAKLVVCLFLIFVVVSLPLLLLLLLLILLLLLFVKNPLAQPESFVFFFDALAIPGLFVFDCLQQLLVVVSSPFTASVLAENTRVAIVSGF